MAETENTEEHAGSPEEDNSKPGAIIPALHNVEELEAIETAMKEAEDAVAQAEMNTAQQSGELTGITLEENISQPGEDPDVSSAMEESMRAAETAMKEAEEAVTQAGMDTQSGNNENHSS